MAEPNKGTQSTGTSTSSTGASSTGSTTGGSTGSTGTGTSSTGSTGMGTSSTGTGSMGQSTYTGTGAGSSTGSAARMAREQSSMPQGGQAGQAGEAMHQAKQKVTDAYNRASDTMNQTYEQALSYGRSNPGTTMLITFGVGLGVGLLLANSAAQRTRTRRIVPPVMNALSEIASEIFR